MEKKYEILVIENESKNLQNEHQANQIRELEQKVKKLQEKTEVSSPMSSLSYASLVSLNTNNLMKINNMCEIFHIFIKSAKTTYRLHGCQPSGCFRIKCI